LLKDNIDRENLNELFTLANISSDGEIVFCFCFCFCFCFLFLFLFCEYNFCLFDVEDCFFDCFIFRFFSLSEKAADIIIGDREMLELVVSILEESIEKNEFCDRYVQRALLRTLVNLSKKGFAKTFFWGFLIYFLLLLLLLFFFVFHLLFVCHQWIAFGFCCVPSFVYLFLVI